MRIAQRRLAEATSEATSAARAVALDLPSADTWKNFATNGISRSSSPHETTAPSGAASNNDLRGTRAGFEAPPPPPHSACAQTDLACRSLRVAI
jgi:hypothetical protein